MPHINWGNVEEQRAGAGIQTLPSGAYHCVITGAEYVTTKKGESALVVVWDVASGEHKGHFSDKFFEGKDFRHNDYLMLEGKGLGIAKHKLHVLADANPGFTPSTCIEQDQTQPFVGKNVYLLLQERKYTYNGRDQSETRVVDWLSPDEFRSGNFKVPDTIDERTPHDTPTVVHAPSAPQIEVAEDDIPF